MYWWLQAASFGGTNIDRAAWEDKKCPGESRFPAQVFFPFPFSFFLKIINQISNPLICPF